MVQALKCNINCDYIDTKKTFLYYFIQAGISLSHTTMQRQWTTYIGGFTSKLSTVIPQQTQGDFVYSYCYTVHMFDVLLVHVICILYKGINFLCHVTLLQN